MAGAIVTSDESIVAALRAGDNATLKELYKNHWPMVLNFVLLNSGTKEDAEELYQEGIIALYEKVKQQDFVLTSSLKTYIYAICRNKWLHELSGRKSILDIEDHTDIVLENTEENDSDRPKDEEIMNAISKLGEPCFSLLIGFYYEKLSMDMLASKLTYANANVARQQKFRCIDRLKKVFLPNRLKYAND